MLLSCIYPHRVLMSNGINHAFLKKKKKKGKKKKEKNPLSSINTNLYNVPITKSAIICIYSAIFL